MEKEIRVHVFPDDKPAYKIPTLVYEGILNRNCNFPEFSGKHMRFAISLLEIDGEGTHYLIEQIYRIVTFDAAGFADDATEQYLEDIQISEGVLNQTENLDSAVHLKDKRWFPSEEEMMVI